MNAPDPQDAATWNEVCTPWALPDDKRPRVVNASIIPATQEAIQSEPWGESIFLSLTRAHIDAFLEGKIVVIYADFDENIFLRVRL